MFLLACDVHAASVLPDSLLAGRAGLHVYSKPNIYSGGRKCKRKKERKNKRKKERKKERKREREKKKN